MGMLFCAEEMTITMLMDLRRFNLRKLFIGNRKEAAAGLGQHVRIMTDDDLLTLKAINNLNKALSCCRVQPVRGFIQQKNVRFHRKSRRQRHKFFLRSEERRVGKECRL